MGIDEVTGRIVRFLTKAHGDYAPVEQWFLVGIDDDQKAIESVSNRERLENEVVEIVGHIPPAIAAQWKLGAGEVRLVLPGEPIND